MAQKAYLVLENGKVFEGTAFGHIAEATGELVFTTAMTGYLETLTDPSYYGQIVVQTFPLIGNYGVIPADFESPHPYLKAYVVREWCQAPSNFRSEGDIDTFLKEQRIPGICGIDTRELTKIIREHGVMNAALTTDPDSVDREALKGYRITGAVAFASDKERAEVLPEGEERHHVALWDFGAKGNIARELAKRGCRVTVFPSGTAAREILETAPDGIMLSNGPGDPVENTGIVEQARELMGAGKPVFGICLGHQLMALAQGGTTVKLKYGHRGANQPVKYLPTGKVYISSQNHGYAVDMEHMPENAEATFVNVNDGTCEGLGYRDMPAFSVQFHPEACGGPLDTSFLFDRFMQLMEGRI